MAFDRVRRSAAHRVGTFLRGHGYQIQKIDPKWPLRRPTDPVNLEVLADIGFQSSLIACGSYTLLDTARLANLWQLSRTANPDGNVVEVGTYRGGSALHLSNARPQSPLFVCDTFNGFPRLDPQLDSLFDREMFIDTSRESVEQLLCEPGRLVTVVAGEFPKSVSEIRLDEIAFAHVDVDTWQGTIETLNYLGARMARRSLIVVGDYLRGANGVTAAVSEFVEAHTGWVALPLWPGQGLLIHPSWVTN